VHNVRLVVALAATCALSTACASHKPRSTDVTPATSPIRGTEEQADSVSDQDRNAVYRTLLRDFYRPTSGQAQWIDTRALGEKRGAADSAARAMSDDEVPPDASWAESVAEASGLQRVCVLGGAEDNCRGRRGGVLRFSPVYAAGPGRVRVFASYTPHGGDVGPISEMGFTLARRSDEWHIVNKTSVPSPE
jgi:hypothetical protein